MAALRPLELSKKIVRNFIGLANTDPLPHLPNRSSMTVMLWNCRGTGNKIFRKNFRELVRVHRPNVVALFETKVPFSSMGLFFNHLGFTASTFVDPVRQVGGIWLICDPTQVSVSAHIANSQVIQATVKRENYEEWVLAVVYASLNPVRRQNLWNDLESCWTSRRENYEEWVLAVVYASPNPGRRQNLWNDLEDFSNSMFNPWLVAGDFNNVMGQNEMRSFTQNNQHNRCRKFLDNINHCGLMNLGCTGPKFTWSNNRQGLANTMERLDRALCNAEWRIIFLEGAVQNLPRTYSDHSPLMVYTEGITKLSPINRPFHFEAAWLSHPSYKDIVNLSWNHESFLQENLSSLATNSLVWNKDVFGNIFKRKRWLLSRIEGIQKAQHFSSSHNLFLLEKDLISQYNKTLFQEEVLWFQKSRANWITQDHIQNYFISLLNNEPVDVLDHWCNIATHKFSHDENKLLLRNITKEEIWEAVKNINSFKAPGRDGFQAIFYQKFWDVISTNVCGFIKNCFQEKHIPPVVNQTLIALIPKTNIPENITQFHPISMCNVSYKILSKLLVNRIRPLLNDLVSPNQSSFIPNRATHDNIIITQQLIHTLRHKKGKYGGLVIKIDLEKVYDKLSWDFLRATLEEFNLNQHWIDLIMSCVAFVSFSILWNGETMNNFSPGRGLRQGDPLSPYLFVLCMERLSNMIKVQVEKGKWKGLKASNNSPPVLHLFFADDLLLFAKADQSNCDIIMETMSEFCCISRQRINLKKSKMFISPNVNRNLAKELSQ
ncbi:uncharacterized protein LOC114270505 [Camellia sinensis]|uniref:uncharacterized protein LOC114270505 n=1 Tax=Camellia sinensis TaxID=4442 RepID=UPI001035B971|nr:uncharacterized protein LOC114270505 [Camellia sinensis]